MRKQPGERGVAANPNQPESVADGASLPAYSVERRRPFPFWLVWAGFGLAYASVAWPALANVWWQSDDFELMERTPRMLLQQHHANGRPVQSLWLLTFLLERNFPPEAAAVAARTAQILLHALAATLIAAAFWRVHPRPAAILASLPFLLSGISGEAALWLSAGAYPLSLVLAMSGTLLLMREPLRHRRVGAAAAVALLVLAMLSNQAAPFGAVAVWAIVTAVWCLTTVRMPTKRHGLQLAYLLVGIGIGGVISLMIGAGSERVRVTHDVGAKLHFLAHLNELVILFPRVYPRLLRVTHLLLLIIVPTLLLARSVLPTRGEFVRIPWRITLIAALGLASLFAVPHAASLLVGISWPSLRIMYVAPLLWSGLWIAGRVIVRNAAAGVAPLFLLLAINSACDIHTLRREAAARVALFQHDLATLEKIEAVATSHNTNRVFVLRSPDASISNWNPYDIQPSHAGNRTSNLQIPWSVYPFVRRFSRLKAIRDRPHVMRQVRRRFVHRDRARVFQIEYEPRYDAVVVCPP